MNQFKLNFLVLASLGGISSASGAILISGVVDGTQTGGLPKAIEIVSTVDGTDLSDYFILRDTNGSSGGIFTVSDDYQLPPVVLNAGEFFYVYGNSGTETIMEGFGIGDTDSGTAEVDGIANHNGDDILALSTSVDPTDVFDSYGLLGQDDTNFAPDSIMYRNANTAANPTGVLDAGNFTQTAYSDGDLQSIFGTYEVIPEPSAVLLTSLAFLGLFGRRR